MARIAGVDIPREKRVVIALTYIYGVGRTRAEQTCAATDIDTEMVAQGAAGIYAADRVAAIPEAIRRAHVEGIGGDSVSMSPRLRSLIAFRPLNLLGPWPMRGPFDVIFCRNVVIYFDDATQEQVWKKFIDVMNPGARLYIGHSERVSGDGGRLVSDGLTAYRLEGAR